MCLCKDSDFEPLLECSFKARKAKVGCSGIGTDVQSTHQHLHSGTEYWKNRRLDFENQELGVCGKN
jgi:hypothetical protein